MDNRRPLSGMVKRGLKWFTASWVRMNGYGCMPCRYCGVANNTEGRRRLAS